MTSRQLQYVITVAEEQSFSTAAKKLFVSQPSLSEFIRKVEEELGYKLFDRTVTPLRLTIAGEVYVETAKKILNLERMMTTRLHDLDESEFGRLSVGVSPYSSLLPSTLKRFFETLPNYEVYIEDSVGTAERLRLLEQGDLDLCIQPSYETLSKKFAAEKIMLDSLLLAVPADFDVNELLLQVSTYDDDRGYPEILPEALRLTQGVPFLTVNSGKHLRQSVDSLFASVGIKPALKVISHKSESCLDMAIAGVGATIVQHSLTKGKEALQNVRCYLIRHEKAYNTVSAVYVRGRYLSKAARVFIDAIKRA